MCDSYSGLPLANRRSDSADGRNGEPDRSERVWQRHLHHYFSYLVQCITSLLLCKVAGLGPADPKKRPL